MLILWRNLFQAVGPDYEKACFSTFVQNLRGSKVLNDIAVTVLVANKFWYLTTVDFEHKY